MPYGSRDYRMYTDKSWLETEDDLETQFRKWGVTRRNWRTKRLPGRGASLRWLPKGAAEGAEPVTLEATEQASPEANLRKLFKIVESLRSLEIRGYQAEVASYFAQTTALAVRDEDRHDIYADYTFFGVRPDAPTDSIKAIRDNMLKRYHPDRYQGEDGHQRAVAINAAWDRITELRGGE